MNEEDIRRRIATQMDALAAEREVMAPYRQRVSTLQTKVANLCARAVREQSRSMETSVAVRAVRTEIEACLREIETFGKTLAIGPADDCRRALRTLDDRLSRLAER